METPQEAQIVRPTMWAPCRAGGGPGADVPDPTGLSPCLKQRAVQGFGGSGPHALGSERPRPGQVHQEPMRVHTHTCTLTGDLGPAPADEAPGIAQLRSRRGWAVGLSGYTSLPIAAPRFAGLPGRLPVQVQEAISLMESEAG